MKLDPVNFAFIMATGVLSIAFHLTEWPWISMGFLIVGTFSYILLIILFIIKFCKEGLTAIENFDEIATLLRCLTFSAGTNSLAERYALSQYNLISCTLLIIGTTSAILIIYTIFFFLLTKQTKKSIQAISPFWLLITIATNSIGIVITCLWANGYFSNPLIILFGFSFWTFGVFSYLFFMTLNLYRMFFFTFNAKELNPSYWTCMGAAAIGVVDGCRLLIEKTLPPFLVIAKPFIAGMVLALWAWGTAFIPFLLIIGFCKHFCFKANFQYEPSLWAMVFPLGMYTVATHYVTINLHADAVGWLIPIFLWISFGAWILIAYKSRFNPYTKDVTAWPS